MHNCGLAGKVCNLSAFLEMKQIYTRDESERIFNVLLFTCLGAESCIAKGESALCHGGGLALLKSTVLAVPRQSPFAHTTNRPYFLNTV